jgi:hypothetical protein
MTGILHIRHQGLNKKAQGIKHFGMNLQSQRRGKATSRIDGK